MDRNIYMDYQATTPVDPRVLDAMLPYLEGDFGNAASGSHSFGWAAQAAVKKARAQCADALGGKPAEIVFTSGSTEGINLALKGFFELEGKPGDGLVTCTTEHPAVLDCAGYLEGKGVDVTYLPVNAEGCIDLDELRDSLTDQVRMVALMAANNEIGTLHPLREIGEMCREQGILFFCDATQGVGKIPLDVREDHIDLLSISSHKFYGPKGAGVLHVSMRDPAVRVAPLFHGGGHERDMRSGTLNVPGIVGLGEAAFLADQEQEEEAVRLLKLRRRLHDRIQGRLSGVVQNGHPELRLPGNLSLSFEYCEGEALMMDMKKIAVSAGSACNTGSLEPSHVLTAIGLSREQANSTLRFGLGRMTTEEEVDFVADATVAAVQRLRDMSPLYEMAKQREEAAKSEKS